MAGCRALLQICAGYEQHTARLVESIQKLLGTMGRKPEEDAQFEEMQLLQLQLLELLLSQPGAADELISCSAHDWMLRVMKDKSGSAEDETNGVALSVLQKLVSGASLRAAVEVNSKVMDAAVELANTVESSELLVGVNELMETVVKQQTRENVLGNPDSRCPSSELERKIRVEVENLRQIEEVCPLDEVDEINQKLHQGVLALPDQLMIERIERDGVWFDLPAEEPCAMAADHEQVGRTAGLVRTDWMRSLSVSAANEDGWCQRRQLIFNGEKDETFKCCLCGAHTDAVQFDSNFESGNLRRAERVAEYEYDLHLSADTNTKGHTQWFYFQVRGMQRGHSYQFNLVNLSKAGSLYTEGLLPLVFSSSDQRWRRRGREVCYYRNNRERYEGRRWSTLSFVVDCDEEGEEEVCWWLAHCYPFTYTAVGTYEKAIQSSCENICRQSVLCKSGYSDCSLLTITNWTSSEQQIASRPVIILSARVHPGETPSSWVLLGLLQELLGVSEAAVKLRQNVIVKVVPMLNPEGVMCGNYRCSVPGADLNRCWQKPSQKLAPSVVALKEMIRQDKLTREVLLYCDFHAHSRKSNVFLYGCERQFAGSAPECSGIPLKPGAAQSWAHYHPKLFPSILAKHNPKYCFKSSSFHVSKSKAGTARIVALRELAIPLSYTLETTFGGCTHDGNHLCCAGMIAVGASFCQGLETMLDRKHCRQFEQQEWPGWHEPKRSNASSEGSDGDPSGDNLSHAELCSRLEQREMHLRREGKRGRRLRSKKSSRVDGNEVVGAEMPAVLDKNSVKGMSRAAMLEVREKGNEGDLAAAKLSQERRAVAEQRRQRLRIQRDLIVHPQASMVGAWQLDRRDETRVGGIGSPWIAADPQPLAGSSTPLAVPLYSRV